MTPALTRVRPTSYPCGYCDHVSATEGESKRHRGTHPHSERVLTCPQCGRVFRNHSGAFRRHVESHEGIDERFFAFVHMTDGCWLWKGAQDSNGYPVFTIHHRQHQAHRVLFERTAGEIPDGLELDHLCRVRHCVRPDHLEPVTHDENTRRAHEATRGECPHCGLESTRGNLVKHIRSKHAGVSKAGQDT